MASPFRVEWTDSAYADLAEIIHYIARDSPINASKVYARIRKRADTLRTLPERGHFVPELVGLEVLSYRELSIPPYRLVYRIDKRTVFVLAVLDARRELKQVLSERIIRSDSAEEVRLHTRVGEMLGTISGKDLRRSKRASSTIRKRLATRHRR